VKAMNKQVITITIMGFNGSPKLMERIN
jgi:hypothetical protein